MSKRGVENEFLQYMYYDFVENKDNLKISFHKGQIYKQLLGRTGILNHK